MSPELIGLIGMIVLLILFIIKIPVGVALLLVGFAGYSAIRGFNIGMIQLGTGPFDTASSYSLSVIPLFILMGMILSYCGLGADLFRAVDSWIGHVKGGLAMATIGTSAIFSAISGSVNATTATVAKICLPEMEKYNYKSSLSTSSVAAGGTLGVLIPPSVLLILYGVLTGEAIGALLIAGIIPGLIQMGLFMLTIYILVKRNPEIAPARAEKASFAERFHTLKSVVPFIGLFVLSIGGIYIGIFTPTEAAGIGAFGALVYAFASRRINIKKLVQALNDSIRLTAMIFLILIGTTVFSQFLSISKIPFIVTRTIAAMDVSPYVILALILFILLILGMFIEGLSIFVLTLPIIYPLVTDLGFNGLWFGIIMVLIVNIGLLTPPLGVSVFVIKGVARHVPIETIFRGVTPMIGAMIACILLFILFPQFVTILPELMSR
ncbi:C4-dicarboxylate transporter [Bacillus sp. OxB-1]|uniref:TRAP transporter large permease n=1 Tax=Bacillus sp. (strain OxB-1) TaxID=98228 RepID=UPI000582389A|nr:TRAP transporter large permease [Bacillus sp. OxB-1]BAQ08583.1 C4-dicarboxylate transporter [Bacillus sp. OxB-1]